MADIANRFLPAKPEIVVEVYDVPTFGGPVEFWPGRIVGVQLPDGNYDPAWPPKITLTENEAFALAGMLSKATGHEIRGLPTRAEMDAGEVDIEAAFEDASGIHRAAGIRSVKRLRKGGAA